MADQQAILKTNKGDITVTLFPDHAPETVANFTGLAEGTKSYDAGNGKSGPFYDGLIFHRVILGFMIQGGDPLGTGTGGPGYQFRDEIAPDMHHEPGTLAMANAGPNTNGSQFFIDEVEASWLDNHHTIFGQCQEVETIAAIAKVPRDQSDKPTQPVVIRSISFARVEP